MADSAITDADRDPHFIGWLPIPRALARFLLPVAAGLVVAAAIVAVLIAPAQRSPGAARWNDDSTTLEGIVYAEPYAMLRAATGPNGEVQTILLVEEGKFGAKDRVQPFDGQPVRVTGTLLHRDGRRMLEIAAGESGLAPIDMPAERQFSLWRAAPVSRGRVVLDGEIVDSKCYLGAMKPGEGITHKGCAVLCLRGGVPPMFVTRDSAGHTTYYLLTGPDGGPMPPSFLELVGEPVRLEGLLESWDELFVLKVAAEAVRRVGPTTGRR
jgi:hypothetical protein